MKKVNLYLILTGKCRKYIENKKNARFNSQSNAQRKIKIAQIDVSMWERDIANNLRSVTI